MICSLRRKALVRLPLFDGRVDKNDDRRFKVVTFLEMKDNFRELSEWTEKLTKMLEQEDFDACEFDKKKRKRFINERPTLKLSLRQSQK